MCSRFNGFGKSQVSMVLIGLTVFASSSVLAAKKGTRDGGGATGAVCFKDPNVIGHIKSEYKNDGISIAPGDVLLVPGEYLTDDKVESVNVLDLIEARSMKNTDTGKPLELIEIRADQTVLQFVESIIARFKEVLPGFHQLLQEAKNRLSFEELSFAPDGIIPFDDVAPVSSINFKQCVLSTIAYQEGERSAHNLLHVDGRIFEGLSEQRFSKMNRATTILHEIVYKFLRTNFAVKDSRTARLLVAMMLRKDLTLGSVARTFDRAKLGSLERLGELSIGGHSRANYDRGDIVYLNGHFKYLFYSQTYGLNSLVDDFFNAMWSDPGMTNLEGLRAILKSSFIKSVNQLLDGRKIKSLNEENQNRIFKQAHVVTTNEHLPEIKKAIKDYYIQSGWRSRFENFAGLDLQQGRLAADIIESLLRNLYLTTNISVSDLIFYADDLNEIYGGFYLPSKVQDSILDQFNAGVLNSKIP